MKILKRSSKHNAGGVTLQRPHSAAHTQLVKSTRRSENAWRRRNTMKYESEKPVYGRRSAKFNVANEWIYEAFDAEPQPSSANGVADHGTYPNTNGDKTRPHTTDGIIQLAGGGSSDGNVSFVPRPSSIDEPCITANTTLRSSGLADYSRMAQSSQMNPVQGSNHASSMEEDEDVQEQQLVSVLAMDEAVKDAGKKTMDLPARQNKEVIAMENQVTGSAPWEASDQSASPPGTPKTVDRNSSVENDNYTLPRRTQSAQVGHQRQSMSFESEDQLRNDSAAASAAEDSKTKATLIDMSMPSSLQVQFGRSAYSRPRSAFSRRPHSIGSSKGMGTLSRTSQERPRFRDVHFPLQESFQLVPMHAGSNVRLMSHSRRLQLHSSEKSS
eukprot:gb/GECG01003736.1/.p1 GENE.gb/GECG01003736.1/~~gb/GECG01003736.1/.p1  ORF type:complete len:384 (+),score=51.13 gb/GECG01003736.1/:1-1152(+)